MIRQVTQGKDLVALNCPLIMERSEAVDVTGVQLFLHDYEQKLADAPLRSSRFTIQPHCGTCEDRHAVHEIWFVSRGTLDICYDGAWYEITAGQAVFFQPWKSHRANNTRDTEVQVISVWWE
jgi:mannose-6-phosphate isomerase-like protein (cupin superfamily)